MNSDDLEWLAGLCDAEACFCVNMNRSRRGNIVVTFQVGLVRHDVVEVARRLIIDVVGEAVPEMHVRPATATQREFYSVVVVAKRQVRLLVETLVPHLQGKRAEALVSADILGRADGGNYVATEVDRKLCGLSHRIKKGDLAAKDTVAILLSVAILPRVPTSAWLAGMLDGDGSICIVRETRGAQFYYFLIVNISSSDRSAIVALREVVALTYRVTNLTEQKAKAGARPSYGFNVAVEDIKRFLTALRPHLRVKSAEADVMLDVCRGNMSREDAYPLLRRLKKEDDPQELLAKLAANEEVPSKPERVSRMKQYRRPTYAEMKERGLWSSEEARKHLGGVGHASWMRITRGLVPTATIGNKKYYSPESLREHVGARLEDVVRVDARERMRSAMESWKA